MNKLFSGKRLKYMIYFGALVTIGSAGFYSIGGAEWTIVDSIYMTIITLSTVGYGEVHQLTDLGKIWTVLVIVFGVSGFAVIIYELGAELIQINTSRSRSMLKKISKLKNHYIICGYGRMGAVIAGEFHKKKIPFVVVELNETKVTTINELGYTYIHGDATFDDTLIDAGIEGSKGVVVVLDNDQDNLFVTMSARNLNQEAYLISRCSINDTGKKLKRAGANKVVNPYITGGHRMAELLITPYMEDTVSLETQDDMAIDFSIEEFSIEHLNTLNGKSIGESKLRENYELLIVGIIDEKGNSTLNPGSETILSSEKKIMIIGSSENLTRFKDNLHN
ncbi:MAG: potassium channel protein [Candidatus Marinimicrobia bacterium]|jgi:voltage-gated potassium channel|nr:potassium channel protein [Candidatus Neomarinimicrobiota bacterium]MBT3675817.1 potassium channel protein [Candidatus Neomarinimicrobiota bacterium]MBT3762979.1 potassium channel protein [Candidatus Neomarinimicrobiota bacterium]MBT4069126.1 potassium channel protein [Candidatus Neomarinimicrobiota bacterium]MBT4271512.1 potassium channel protein [Candidatus Neomarinimicrobiota bacterium]